jgi:hypothetical protein
LEALPWTYHSFGNNGSVPLHGCVDDPSNTALAELDNQWEVLHALAHACSDHIPVLQEYQIVTPGRAATLFQSARSVSEVIVPKSPTRPFGAQIPDAEEESTAITRHTTVENHWITPDVGAAGKPIGMSYELKADEAIDFGGSAVVPFRKPEEGMWELPAFLR